MSTSSFLHDLDIIMHMPHISSFPSTENSTGNTHDIKDANLNAIKI